MKRQRRSGQREPLPVAAHGAGESLVRDQAVCAIRKSLIDVRNSTAKILEQHSLADALADKRKMRPAA